MAPVEAETINERDVEAEEEPVDDCETFDVVVNAIEFVKFVEIVAAGEIVISSENDADTEGDGVFVDETVEDVLKLRQADELADIVGDTDDEGDEVTEFDEIELKDGFTETEADDETVVESEGATVIEEFNELLDKGDSLAVREKVPLSEGEGDMVFATEKLAVDDVLTVTVTLRDSAGVCDCSAVIDADTLAQPEFESEAYTDAEIFGDLLLLGLLDGELEEIKETENCAEAETLFDGFDVMDGLAESETDLEIDSSGVFVTDVDIELDGRAEGVPGISLPDDKGVTEGLAEYVSIPFVSLEDVVDDIDEINDGDDIIVNDP